MKLISELVVFIFVYSLNSVDLSIAVLNNINGTECDSYLGVRGQCLDAKKCTTLQVHGKTYTQQKQALLNSVCSYENGKLYICCPSNKNATKDINKSIKNSTLCNEDYPLPIKISEEYINDNFINKFIKNSSQFLTKPPACGQSFDERTRQSITLGEIKEGQYPWIGTVGEISDEEEIEISQVTLITKRHVLSTAHTIYRALENYIKLNYVWFSVYDDKHVVDVYEIPVLDILIHPDFNNTYYINNIALFKLEFEVSHPYLRPICMPTIPALSNVIYDGLKAVLYTLMDTTNAENNEILKTFEETHYVEIISNQKCIEQYGNGWKNTIEKSSLCTKKIYKNDFCSYVGSPLMLPFVNANSCDVSYYLIGFRTTGIDVCTNNSKYPQIHLRVADYLNWIENYILY